MTTKRHWHVAERSIGAWTWKPDILWSKVVTGTATECHAWTGSRGPHANLFGAKKNNRPQMTQAHRLLYMDYTGIDVQDLEVRHSCNNRWCTNVKHMFTQPNRMRFPVESELDVQILTVEGQLMTDIETHQRRRVAKWWAEC